MYFIVGSIRKTRKDDPLLSVFLMFGSNVWTFYNFELLFSFLKYESIISAASRAYPREAWKPAGPKNTEKRVTRCDMLAILNGHAAYYKFEEKTYLYRKHVIQLLYEV